MRSLGSISPRVPAWLNQLPGEEEEEEEEEEEQEEEEELLSVSLLSDLTPAAVSEHRLLLAGTGLSPRGHTHTGLAPRGHTHSGHAPRLSIGDLLCALDLSKKDISEWYDIVTLDLVYIVYIIYMLIIK